jgi:hypothetical protein
MKVHQPQDGLRSRVALIGQWAQIPQRVSIVAFLICGQRPIGILDSICESKRVDERIGSLFDRRSIDDRYQAQRQNESTTANSQRPYQACATVG